MQLVLPLLLLPSSLLGCLPNWLFPAPAPAPAAPASDGPDTRAVLRNTTDCGQQGGGRIVGGSEAGQWEFPWQCALLDSQVVQYDVTSEGILPAVRSNGSTGAAHSR